MFSNKSYPNQFKFTNKSILLFILFIGAILRFYHFDQLPFSHDELSALLRCEFTDFNMLIEKGVKTDFHPAGIQVFLYYWIKLFGTAEWIVKLPFAFASVYSIYVLYKIGEIWKNETIGLIASAFLATTQIAIHYGTLARPYSIGLLLILLLFKSLLVMADYKNSLRDNKYWWNWSCFILCGTAAAYTHHFGMLVAGLIGIVGIFMVGRKQILNYLLAGGIILLLYLPHVSILFFQLEKGGVGGIDGWLGKPTPTFLWDFISYIFHYSLFTIIFTVLLILYGFFQSKIDKKYVQTLIISLVLFFVPYLIGYYYSIYLNPIIQFSVLIFSHFFLYFILFGHFKNVSVFKNALIVALILIVNSVILVINRKHFELTESSYYTNSVENLIQYNKEYDREIPAIIECSPTILDFYKKRRIAEPNYKNYKALNIDSSFLKLLDSIAEKSDMLYFGSASSAPPKVIPLIRSYFPELIKQRNYLGGTTYIFGKKRDNRAIISNYSDGILWSDKNNRVFKKIKNEYYFSDSLEFSPSFEISLEQLKQNKFITISLDITDLEENSDFHIIAQLEQHGKLIDWTGTSVNTLEINGNCKILVHSFEITNDKKIKDGIIKIYLWNPKHKSLHFKDIIIATERGNPIIYGLNLPL